MSTNNPYDERDICTGVAKDSIHQLNKLDKQLGNRKRRRIYPLTYIQAVFDAKSGTRLDAILDMVNSIYLPWKGTARATRIQVPFKVRRKGLMISYRNIDNEIITEKCITDECVKDDIFGLDSSWVLITDALPISGNVTIGSNGNWFVDGEDTGFKAQGPKGASPSFKTDQEGNLVYSYDGLDWVVAVERTALLLEADNLKSLFLNAGASYDSETLKYSLNGLADITENEMCVIYNDTNAVRFATDAVSGSNCRTTLPNMKSVSEISLDRMFKDCPLLEIVGNITNSNIIKPADNGFVEAFSGCAKLTTINPSIDLSLVSSSSGLSGCFTGCAALTTLHITGLKTDISFSDSPLLSKDSLLEIINGALNESAINITLEATSHATLSVDEEVTAAISSAGTSGHTINLISA